MLIPCSHFRYPVWGLESYNHKVGYEKKRIYGMSLEVLARRIAPRTSFGRASGKGDCSSAGIPPHALEQQ